MAHGQSNEPPSTDVAIHMLIGPNQLPAISADTHDIDGREVTYLRMETDTLGAERRFSRHSIHVSLSGPRADVVGLVEQMTARLAAL